MKRSGNNPEKGVLPKLSLGDVAAMGGQVSGVLT
jgi:hypothetical protein